MYVQLQSQDFKSYTRKKTQKKLPLLIFKFIFLTLISITLSSLYIFFTTDSSIYKTLLVPYHPTKVKEYTTFTVCLQNAKFLQPDLENITSKMEFNGIKRFKFVTDADTNCDVVINMTNTHTDTTESKQNSNICSIYLLPVGHIYWINDSIETADLNKQKILISNNISQDLVIEMLKMNGIQNPKIKTVNTNTDLLKSLKNEENKGIGLISFNELNPQFKLLSLNNQYFLDSLRKDKYDGSISISLDVSGTNDFAVKLLTKRIKNSDFYKNNCINYDNLQVSKVIMTGVTAITRSLAIKINSVKQYDWPAQKIASFLKDADLTHVSNEISFVPGCKPTGGTRFCSDPKYIKTLESIGVDIIELTGNHNNDYGAKYNTSTIQTYKSKHWDYFGGGLNAQDAAKILYKEVNGTKIAFIGYNYYDTMLKTYAIATDSHAGANSFSFSKLKKDITTAKKNADVVIVDFQFQECYAYPSRDMIYPICYKPLFNPDQKKVFRTAIDYGADIVIGTQAHQPQTYEVYKDRLIFYGLGNLFFDQTKWIGTRQGLILTHYFYNGKHIQTKITTTLYDRDMRTYITTGKDRTLLLKLLRDAR